MKASSRTRWIGFLVVATVALALFAARRLRTDAAGAEGPELETNVGVHVGAIRRATLRSYVTAYGRVEPEPPASGKPPAEMLIGSPVVGILAEIDCAEGRQVTRGDTLFRLDNRAAEVAVAGARKALEFAEKTYERQKALLPVEGTSQKALLEAEQIRDAARTALAGAQTQLELLRIAAPLTGTVVRIDAKLGQSVEASTVLAAIVDLQRLVVEAGVPSREVARLHKGQAVEIGSGGSVSGKLMFIGTDVDPETDTIVVRASLPARAELQPGRFLEIRIVAEEHRDCLAVPQESLVARAGEGAWIVLVDGDRAVRKPVTAGLREGSLVEVSADGLEDGTAIVTEDAYSLPPETKIRILGR